MGYIKIFGEQLEAKLTKLPPEEREAVIQYAKELVLQSYKNGLRDARTERKSAPPSKKRA